MKTDTLNNILADYGFTSVLDGACETQAERFLTAATSSHSSRPDT